MRLAGKLVNAGELSEADRAAMLGLMQRHYAQVQPAAFAADLAEKDWVIQVRDPHTDQLCGFSTQMLLETTVEGRSIHALFSGDTIVDRDCWGDVALSHCWGHLALALIDAQLGGELYWFLLSQGQRTYRFLPLFFHEYYPSPQQAMPRHAAQLLDNLAREKFATRFDAASGVVRANGHQYWLRRDLATIDAGRSRDPSVRYFWERNPGHLCGDELCCLAPLSRNNFTAAAWRVIGTRPCPFEVPLCVSPVG